uniref:Dead end protein homolog 1 n=1 Tax=Camelus bactrianus TaxID=9837 RepID=A0A9W3FCS1_CAMBA|nr:dead end protein homolog 1 [Camelus bactrianus]
MQSKRECELWCERVNPENKAALEAWVRETGIRLVQVNGQRKYGGPPPGWVGSPPPAGSEVFIGRLPQDVYEHQLIPLFQRVGRLYEFRLMMTFSGLNRGFAYARYSSRRGAQAAITCPISTFFPAGQSRLCGEQVAVEWLKPDLKQRLRQQLVGPSLRCLQPESSQLALAGDKLEFQGAQATLQLMCQQMNLGSPVFLTKCLGTGFAGWHRFWYQVVIPGHPVPFSGLIWVVLARDGQDGHEVAKEAVSAQLLEALSESGASLLRSFGAEAGTWQPEQVGGVCFSSWPSRPGQPPSNPKKGRSMDPALGLTQPPSWGRAPVHLGQLRFG